MRVTGVKCCTVSVCTCGALSGSVAVTLEAVAAVSVGCNGIGWVTDSGVVISGWTSSCGRVYER